MTKPDVVYWMRFGLAILVAIICNFLRLNLASITVGIGVYIVSYFLARYIVRIETSSEYDLFFLGMGTYSITWITFWILFNTLLLTI